MSSRGSIFMLQMAYLAGLGALALLYFKGIWIHTATLGTVPIAVLWWGALGAILLSLSGIFDHCKDWDPCFKYWHWARPFVGAAMAGFGILALQGGVLAAGNTLTSQSGVTNPRSLFYYVVAFVLGYREETTRALIKRVADVIIAPGDTSGGGSSRGQGGQGQPSPPTPSPSSPTEKSAPGPDGEQPEAARAVLPTAVSGAETTVHPPTEIA